MKILLLILCLFCCLKADADSTMISIKEKRYQIMRKMKLRRLRIASSDRKVVILNELKNDSLVHDLEKLADKFHDKADSIIGNYDN